MIDINRTEAQTNNSPTNVVLADGAFQGAEAQDLALTILDATIQFYKLQNLRSGVHQDSPDPAATLRIQQLSETRRDLIQAFREAKATGQRLRLGAELSVEADQGFRQR